MIVPDEKSGVKRIRCAPQVLGTVRDTLTFVQGILEIELNAATDNPLIFLDEDALSRSYKMVSFIPITMLRRPLNMQMKPCFMLRERSHTCMAL